MRPILIALSMLAVSVTGGCASSGSLPELAPARSETGYTLGSGDKLRITVYGEEKLTGE